MEITKEACRVCLRGPLAATNGQWESDSINDIDHKDNISYAQKFTTCTRIPLTMQYAKKICKRCIYHLKKAYTFYMICQRTEQILQNYMQRENKRKVKYATRDQQSNDNNIDHNLSIKIEPKTEDTERNCNKLLTASVKTEKLDNENDETTSQLDNFNDPDYSDNEDDKPLANMKKSSTANVSEEQSTKQSKRKASEEEPSLICEICGNIYKRRHLLVNHMRMHSGKKDFKCEICGKEFLLATYLTSHMKTHTGIKNFSCSFCSRKFYSNGKRTAHEKIHRGETSYQCKICDKIFKYSQSLKKHLFIHSGMKPHKCPECDKEFRTMCNLRQHLSSAVHKDKTNNNQASSVNPVVINDRQQNDHQQEEVASAMQTLQQPYIQIFNNAYIPSMRQEQPQQQQRATDFSWTGFPRH